MKEIKELKSSKRSQTMIYGAKLIGKELLNVDLVKEFRYMYQNLRKIPNLTNDNIHDHMHYDINITSEKDVDLVQQYFRYNDSLSLQFDGFLALYANLKNEKPSEVNQIEGFKEFVIECTRLATISNLIIFMLNTYVLDDEVISILETPYDNIFDKNSIKDESKLKNAFKIILKTDVDTLFDLIKNLRDDFFDSELYSQYSTALKNDGNVMKYEIDIQALFYIIKQIIYQYIIDGQMKFINDNNIIIYNRNSSLDGNFFEIKYQPSNLLNNLFSTDIIEIMYEGKKELGVIRHIHYNFSREKGAIIEIKGEILSNNGLNINSPSNKDINEFLNKIGHWYNYFDNEYKGIQ